MNKVKVTGSEIFPAHRMRFTPDSKRLISATCQGSVQLIQIVDSQPTLIHTFSAEPGNCFIVMMIQVKIVPFITSALLKL